jgi:hypothetical protein
VRNGPCVRDGGGGAGGSDWLDPRCAGDRGNHTSHLLSLLYLKVPHTSQADLLGVRVAVKQQNTQALEDSLLRTSDPSSPHYAQHLSLEEVQRLVAPSTEDINTVLTIPNYKH